MKTSRSKLAHIIADRTIKNGANSEYVQEIAALLLQERQVGELNSLMRDVQENWAQSGHVEVIARSAHALSAEVVANIKTQITKLYPKAERIIVTQVLDPSVVGGVRLSLANQQLDLSVEAKLHKFKQLTAGKDL